MPFTEISSFGTVDPTGATSSTTTFQSARDGVTPGEPVFVPIGKYDITELTGTGENIWYCHGATNLAQTGLPKLPGIVMGHYDKRFIMDRRKSTDTDVATAHFIRNANHTGGTTGFVNTANYTSTIVSSGVTNFEWASLNQLDNSSTSGENVAGYNQSLKRVDGSTWASVSEIQDFTTDPTTSSVSHEFDLWANGTDTHGNRIVGDFTIGKRDQAGTIPTIQHFTRYANVGNDSSQAQVQIAHYTTSNILDTVYKSYNTHDLSSTVGSVATFVNYGQKTGSNTSAFIVDHLRAQSGSNWDTTTMRFYRKVDNTVMGSLEFRNLTDISFNRSIAITMDSTDFFEANLLKNYARFAQPINLASQSANPASGVPGAAFNGTPNSSDCNQYVKGGKLIWQYNDAGTIRYLSIPLTGTGTTWTHSTTSP